MEFYTRDVWLYYGFFVWILLHDDAQEYNRLCFTFYVLLTILQFLFIFSFLFISIM